MNRDDVILLLKAAKKDIFLKYRIQKIGIFGSVARDNAGEESDIDVYAEFEPEADILDYSALSLGLEELFNRPVDIATPAAIRDEMRSSIMKDVIII